MSRRTPAPKLPQEVSEELERLSDNKSAQIRYLYDKRYSTAQIRSILGLIYQRVRNVIVRYEEQKRKQRNAEAEAGEE